MKANEGVFKQFKEKEMDIRTSNISNAKAIADAVRTSLGPKGMDKMIKKSDGEVIITNDGATILKTMEVVHPTAKMLVDLSTSQDVTAGDGTTSVVVLAGSLLNTCSHLLEKGIHPTIISEGFQDAVNECNKILESMSTKVDLNDRNALLQLVETCLASKVITHNTAVLAPIAVDAILSIQDETKEMDLKDIRVSMKVGGTLDDSEIINGIVFANNSSSKVGPTKIQNAKIAMIQFPLSPPKTDMENSININDYQSMDRILREERKQLLEMCKKIKKSGANVVLVQKSVLRDSTTDLSRHFLAKLGIMLIDNIDRDDVDFVCDTLNTTPIAHVDHLEHTKLGEAEVCEEVSDSGGKSQIQILNPKAVHTTRSILLRASNKLVLEEAKRSLHDALCVLRSIVKLRQTITGGGSGEMECSLRLREYAKTMESDNAKELVIKNYADAIDLLPQTLAENSGQNPINFITELRSRHLNGDRYAGISVKDNKIADMKEAQVIQPLLVTKSLFGLATECVRMILKIDDIVTVR